MRGNSLVRVWSPLCDRDTSESQISYFLIFYVNCGELARGTHEMIESYLDGFSHQTASNSHYG